jgi:acetyltransferase-like isoleucine patch superfamily enzyme
MLWVVRTGVRGLIGRARGRREHPTERRFRELVADGRVEVGRHRAGPAPQIHVFRADPTRVRIGSFVGMAKGVEIVAGGNHPTDWVTTYPLREDFGLPGAYEGIPATRGDVIIENDVWIGRQAVILSGVHVGDGAVIGAHAVVTRDVRPYTVVVGNPAREVRQRFPDDRIDALRRIAWWNWPLDEIVEHAALLAGPDVDRFIERFDPGQAPGDG